MDVKNKQDKIILTGKPGFRVSLSSGMLESGFPERFSTLHFYHAGAGDRLRLSDQRYEYAVAVYSLDRDEVYLYTYAYQREENWAVYTGNLSPASYRQNDFVFTEECYFRLNLKRCDGMPVDTSLRSLKRIIDFQSNENAKVYPCPVFQQEIHKVIKKVESARTADTMAFIILTDSHYVNNGTWEDTVGNIRLVSEKIGPAGIIHLGDLTDGMVHRERTRDYVRWMMNDLKSLGVPLFLTIGNHDTNYFYNNPDKFSKKDQYLLYLKEINPEQESLYYYKDLDKIKTRFIFLDSFDDTESIRYGFSDQATVWFQQTLEETPEGFRVLIFSHIPPLAEIHYWSDEIRNGNQMVTLAEKYGNIPGHRIWGWIHGHNHADQVYRNRSFPIISLGCNKCEYFSGKKPEGAIAYERYQHHVSQDLWDVLLLSAEQEQLQLIRFGAGEDRKI